MNPVNQKHTMLTKTEIKIAETMARDLALQTLLTGTPAVHAVTPMPAELPDEPSRASHARLVAQTMTMLDSMNRTPELNAAIRRCGFDVSFRELYDALEAAKGQP